MLRVIFFLFLLSSSLISLAQHRCATVEYERLLKQKRPSKETAGQFELWMKSQLDQKQTSSQAVRMASVNYEVPVVVHVIHKGEAVGTGTNISDDQILSQIKVLNDDFRRLNADSVNTPTEFLPVEGKFKVSFVLAKQDPNGLATNGIRRVQGSQSSWGMVDDYTLKAESYWPAEKYLNIWVVNLSGGLLGYTQLPSSSTLAGLDGNSIDRLTDGIVIHYRAFGTKAAGSFDLISGYDLGRTVTHEAGHFFGLRHVWGDVFGCGGTDYVNDTPPQDTDFNGLCPSGTKIDCSGSAMYSNYMNYTDDGCMNIFSKGQVARMDVVINNSPRRASLLTSLGSQSPTMFSNDIQLKSLITPATTACSGNVSPALLLHNYGSNNIGSTQIQFLVNGNLTETKTFALSLLPGAEATVFFSPVSLVAGSTYKFSFNVLQTNNVTDGRAYNDTLNHSFKVPLTATLPLVEPFNSMPGDWTLLNPDGLETWKPVAVTGSKNSMEMEFYNYSSRKAVDWLITPVLDLTSETIASINFVYAYSAYGDRSDQLRVLVSTSCDFSSSPVEIFNKAGTDLATTQNQYAFGFVPTSSEWRNKIISLNQFLGKKIQIAFEATNEYGNNLYLDSVTVLNYAYTAFAINRLVSPSPVSCLTTASPVLSIQNLGNSVIESFTTDIYLNRELTSTKQVSNAQLEVNTSKNFTFSELNLSDINTFSFVIKSPNGSNGVSSKDSLTTRRYVNTVKEKIPFRQNFDIDFSQWTSVSPDYGLIWESHSTTKNNSMLFEAFASDSDTFGKHAWLVSPILDLSSLTKASLFFETSYGANPPGEEVLEVFYSTDCGQTFEQQALILSGEDLSQGISSSNSFWEPGKNDWSAPKRYINLDPVAGKKNVRLAFVATNGNGNNLYVDDIEFFADDNEKPLSIDSEYAIYGGLNNTDVEVTFNLMERQTVRLQVYDFMGHVITDQELPDTLNQTYTVESPGYSRGMYIIRIQTQRSTSSTKVYFGF